MNRSASDPYAGGPGWRPEHVASWNAYVGRHGGPMPTPQPPAPMPRAPLPLPPPPSLAIASAWAPPRVRRRSPLRKAAWIATGLAAAFVGGVVARPALEQRALALAARLPWGLSERVTPFVTSTPTTASAPAPVAQVPAQTPPAPAPAAVVEAPVPVEVAKAPAPVAPTAVAPAPTEQVEPAAAPVIDEEDAPRAKRRRNGAALERARHASRTSEARALERRSTAVAAVSQRKPEAPTAAKEPPAPEPPKTAKATDDLDSLMAGAERSKPRRTSKTNDLDELLADAGKGRDHAAPAPSAPAPAATPAPALGRGQIVEGMRAVQADVDECGRQHRLVGRAADLHVTVDRNGTVRGVKVDGALAGTPVARCLSDAVASADFPPSAGLSFPYRVTMR